MTYDGFHTNLVVFGFLPVEPDLRVQLKMFFPYGTVVSRAQVGMRLGWIIQSDFFLLLVTNRPELPYL